MPAEAGVVPDALKAVASRKINFVATMLSNILTGDGDEVRRTLSMILADPDNAGESGSPRASSELVTVKPLTEELFVVVFRDDRRTYFECFRRFSVGGPSSIE